MFLKWIEFRHIKSSCGCQDAEQSAETFPCTAVLQGFHFPQAAFWQELLEDHTSTGHINAS